MSSTATTSPFDLFQQAITHLEDVLKSFQALASSKPWNELGYFDSTQDETIEHLYFRFMACRRVLTSITTKHCEEFELAEQQTKLREQVTAEATNNDASYSMDTLLSLAATLALFVYDASFVETFQSDAIAVNKLNEKFYRVDIEEDTFNLLQLEVTDTKTTGRLKSLALAYVELSKADLPTSDEVAELSLQMLDLVTRGNQLARSLANETDVFNSMEHAKTGEAARQAKHYTRDFLVAARAHTYKAVSRLKIPTAYLIRFSDEQKNAVLEQVEPGDIILTYTSGYASDVFIPGAFKHGITFVGTPEQRIGARLDKATIESTCVDAPESKVHKLLQDVAIRTVTKETNEKDCELDANVIESVAEGVILNNLGYLMDTHINRLLILRPKLTPEEGTEALIETFQWLGNKYDFGFNFADTSAVVCTEVIYHALNGKANIAFELTKRAGHPTLSADDIVNYYLNNPESFDFVLLALEDTSSDVHQAEIYTGEEGNEALIDLMTNYGSKSTPPQSNPSSNTGNTII